MECIVLLESLRRNPIIDEAIQLIKELTPPAYESRKRSPCPNCGSKRSTIWYKSMVNETYIKCDVCGINGPAAKSDIQAIKSWNDMCKARNENKAVNEDIRKENNNE